jgi:phosphoadenosine phosphosulfate reductase
MFDETHSIGSTIPTDLADRESALDLKAQAEVLSRGMAGLTPAERLAFVRRELPGRVALTLGFGIEGQLLFHWICTQNLDIDVVTLDTGRLFPETYDLWALTEARYGRKIRAIYPQAAALEKYVAKHGVNGFYDSVEARQACCGVRKTKPLERALADAQAWITGVRADQTETRGKSSYADFDKSRGLIKINPLLDWTRERVLAEVKANDVPINTLHTKGFDSIGCAPCTRALQPGEPERNGRWWWENGGTRECGLHLPAPDLPLSGL